MKAGLCADELHRRNNRRPTFAYVRTRCNVTRERCAGRGSLKHRRSRRLAVDGRRSDRRLASDASGFGLRDYGWVAGRATSIVVDPGDVTANTVYVGGASGGVWRSSNAATPLSSDVVWTPLLDDQPTLSVGSIAIQPGNSNVLLVGTGKPIARPIPTTDLACCDRQTGALHGH